MSFMSTYHFDTDDAITHGIPEAIILYNLKWWIFKNKTNNTHQHDVEIDGKAVTRTWTYNSAKAFSIQYPWWNSQAIRRILMSLEKKGVVLCGNFNKMKQDRTKWYALKNEDEIMAEVSDSWTGKDQRKKKKKESTESETASITNDGALFKNETASAESETPLPDRNHTDRNQHIQTPPLTPQRGEEHADEISPSKPLDPQNPKDTSSALRPFSKLRNRMIGVANGWYHRRETTQWSPTELRKLTAIMKRPDFIEEVKTLQAYRKHLENKSELDFFPHSISTLLTGWNRHLDQARTKLPQHTFSSPSVAVYEESEEEKKYRQETKEARARQRADAGLPPEEE